MSFSLGSSSKKAKTNQKQEPWAPAIPYLQDYLGQIGNLSGTGGPTAGQEAAFGDLTELYGAGNPFAGQLGDLANETLAGVPSQSGLVGDAYTNLQSVLNPYASGQFLDLENNPYIQDMLNVVGDDVQNRINAQFAGAGRDLSGMNQMAVARGVTQAQLPLLLNQFNQQQANQLGAANTLFGAGTQTGQVMQGLDQAALAGRATGAPLADAAMQATTWGPENLFNLEQIFKDLPAQDLANLGSLLLPVAQLGQQQQGTAKEKGTSFGFGANLLSDERMKEDLQQIGTLADGTPIFRFRYKGEDTTRIGLSAQDLENRAPEAVQEMGMPGGEGVKYVNMDLATRRSADMMRNMPGAPMPQGGAGAGPMPTPPQYGPMLDDLEDYRYAA